MSAGAPGAVPVLFVHYGEDHIRGSEQVLLDLFANLDRARVRPLLWCNAAIMADAARQHGVEAVVSPMHHATGLSGLREAARQLRGQFATGLALVRRHRARLIHANSAAPVQWMLPVARTARVPLLAHLHIAYRRRNLALMLVHQASLVVGVGPDVLADLRRHGVSPHRLRVIENGIDTHRLADRSGADLRARMGIPAEAFVVGVAGSLIPRKATALVLEAFAALHHPCTPWLLVAGDGPDREQLVLLAGRLGIAARTIFLGTYKDAGAAFRAMDVQVLASYSEGLPLVLIEAAMCGVARVASDIPGIRGVLAHERTGLLVSAGDTAALAAAMQRLADDTSLRHRLAVAGKAEAIARFGATRMAADFHAAYADLLAAPAHQAGWLGAWRHAGSGVRLLLGLRHGAGTR